jgi:rubredoxin
MAIEPLAASAALSAVKNAFAILKGITGTIREMGKAEMLNDLIELQTAILEIQEKQAELLTENQTMKEELDKLKQTKALSEKMTFLGSVYQIREAGNKDGVYCPSCYDSASKFVRLHKRKGEEGGDWICMSCGLVFDP